MNLDEMIAAERSTPAKATKAEAGEVWRSIERSFVSVVPAAGAPAAAAGTTLGKLGGALTSTAGKLLLATTLVTGGVVGAKNLAAGGDDTPAAEPSSSLQATAPAAVHAAPAAPAIPPRAMPTPEPAAQPGGVQPAVAEQQPEPPAPEAKPARVRADAKPRSSVKDELALIRQTQSAIRSGAHTRALTLARQHAKTYPNGAFVEDREALRTLALCESGNTKAAVAASSFLERWPKSMHRSRIEAACE